MEIRIGDWDGELVLGLRWGIEYRGLGIWIGDRNRTFKIRVLDLGLVNWIEDWGLRFWILDWD